MRAEGKDGENSNTADIPAVSCVPVHVTMILYVWRLFIVTWTWGGPPAGGSKRLVTRTVDVLIDAEFDPLTENENRTE